MPCRCWLHSLTGKYRPVQHFDAQLVRLSPADREQAADVFRVISMSFAQLDGVDSVDAFFRRNGSRSYADHVYLDLAEFYVEQDQVSEAARTWQALAQRDPLGPEAPRLTARAISLYRQAGFQQRLWKLKRCLCMTMVWAVISGRCIRQRTFRMCCRCYSPACRSLPVSP